MSNLNNVLGNNNVEGGNNMRGQVVIKATTNNNEGRNAFLGYDRELHSGFVKRALRPLYSVAPVYEQIIVTGKDEDGNLQAFTTTVIGGNSPIVREFIEPGAAPCEKTVFDLDSDGNINSWRRILCNVEDKKGVTYHYVPTIKAISFKIEDTYTKEQKAASQALVDDILSVGLTITKDGKVVIGKAEGEYISTLIWTPSNERNGQILMTSVDSSLAWSILERIGGGAITKLLSKGEMSLPKFKKLASRLGLFATPAIKFEKIGTDKHGLLLIDSELLGADDFDKMFKDILKGIGVKIDNNQWDGACYFSAEYCRDGLKAIGMKGAKLQQALMQAMQLRVTKFYAKVFGEALSRDVIRLLAKNIMKIAVDKDGKKLYKVFGNEDSIDMILDSNGAKLADLKFDIEDGADVYLLDIAKGTMSGTATQMTDKYGIFNKQRTKEFLKDRAHKEIHDYANSIGDFSASLLDNNIQVATMLYNIAKSNPESAIADKVFMDQFLAESLLKDTVKKHESMYRKGRVSIDSMFQRALFDITYLLTEGKIDSLLRTDSRGAIECYSTDVLEQYKEEIDAIENSDMSIIEKDRALNKLLTANIIKYPTPGTEEIELVVFLTENQIKRRINEYVVDGTIDAATGVVIFNYFRFTSYGTIKIAADNAIKHKLAGMDTDYDGVVVIFEKELVEILEEVYVSRTEALANGTGSTATYGGMIPFIDSHQDAENFFVDKTNEVEAEVAITSTDAIGKWGDLFK